VKIEQALVYYLLKTKQLTLQGIGTFHLDASVPDYVDSDKPVSIPENAITFNYDPKVTEDEGLVDFIVEHTNKIKPLAASDLDSFLSLARQFLNIGKPLTLQNIGTLEKNCHSTMQTIATRTCSASSVTRDIRPPPPPGWTARSPSLPRP